MTDTDVPLDGAGAEIARVRALLSEGLGCPVRSVQLYWRRGDTGLADADGDLCFWRGGEVFEIDCRPEAPSTCLSQRGETVCVIRNAFYPDEIRRLAKDGGTTEAVTRNVYDIARVCGMLDYASRYMASCTIDETEHAIAVEALRARGAISPETAVDAAHLGLRGFPERMLQGKKRRIKLCKTEDGRYYLSAPPGGADAKLCTERGAPIDK